jgi:hypothetical protein
MIDLSSAKAKLGRAKLHLIEAESIHKRFMKSQFYSARIEKDGKGRFLVKIFDLKQLPPEFALAIGDAAHNFRSALDHIIFSFSKKPLTREEERRIQFPLTTKSAAYPEQRRRCLCKVSPKVQALVDQFQPHHRRKWPNNAYLEQLQAINNWDKHRALAITTTTVKRGTLGINDRRGNLGPIKQKIYSGPLKEGAVIARFEVAKFLPDTEVDVTGQDVTGQIVTVPVFHTGMPKEIINLSVLNRLNKIGDFIENDLLPKFEALG